MAKMNYSRQREAIVNYLCSVTSHPTAEMVYENIKKEYPNISLATVYRNLNKLAENGDILKLSCGGNSDRFDGNTEKHYHFRCEQCDAVQDIHMESIDHINTIANAKFPGEITGHNVYFYGICDICKK